MPRRRTVIEDATLDIFKRAASAPLHFRNPSKRELDSIRWRLINQREALERAHHPFANLAYTVSVGRVQEESPSGFILTLQPHNSGKLATALLNATQGEPSAGAPRPVVTPTPPAEEFKPAFDPLNPETFYFEPLKDTDYPTHRDQSIISELENLFPKNPPKSD